VNMISLTNPSQQNYGNSTIGGSEQSVIEIRWLECCVYH